MPDLPGKFPPCTAAGLSRAAIAPRNARAAAPTASAPSPWRRCCGAGVRGRHRRRDLADPLAPRPPHFAAKAEASSSSTWTAGRRRSIRSTPSRGSTKEHGQPFTMKVEPTQFNNVGNTLGQPLEVPAVRRRAGCRSAICFRTSRKCVDELAVDPLDDVELLRAHQRQLLPAHRARACRAGRAWARGSRYGLGSECRDLPGFVVLNGGLIPPGGLDNFGSGFLPATYQGSIFKPARQPVADVSRAEADAPSCSSDKLDLLRKLDAVAARTRLGDRRPARIGDRQLRTRLPHADGRAGADGPQRARPQRRRSCTASTTEYEPTRLRPAMPARPAAGRARRAVRRADLSRASAATAGISTATCKDGHDEERPGRRPADRRPADRPEAARAARRRRWSSGPASSAARRSPRAATAATTTRSASRSGWPAAASRAARSTARPTSTATTPSRTRSRSTTCTPRCCTCWASTTRG